MRKLLLLVVPAFALGSLGVAQASHQQASAKTPVCATRSPRTLRPTSA